MFIPEVFHNKIFFKSLVLRNKYLNLEILETCAKGVIMTKLKLVRRSSIIYKIGDGPYGAGPTGAGP